MKLEEVARLAGVSRTTASYVINGKAELHRISAATQERVMAVVREHNHLLQGLPPGNGTPRGRIAPMGRLAALGRPRGAGK